MNVPSMNAKIAIIEVLLPITGLQRKAFILPTFKLTVKLNPILPAVKQNYIHEMRVSKRRRFSSTKTVAFVGNC